MADSSEILRLIEAVTLFRGVPHGMLENLLSKSTRVTIEQGEKLLSPEKINENVYILVSGRLSVQARPSLSDKPIAMLASGECVGEMSVLVDGLVSAYVIAATRSELLRIDYDSFWSLIDNSSEAARNMLNILVNRIRLGNRIMADSLIHHENTPDNDIVDNLTGLYNYHGIHRKFDRLLHRCVVDNQPFCIILLEADLPEQAAGSLEEPHIDQPLRVIAQALLTFLRPDDHAARLVGKKFAVLMVNTSLDDAFATTERLRVAIGESPIVLPSGNAMPPVTISAGVIEALPDDKLGTLIARADIILEQAIKAGRNCVARAPEGTQ